MNSSKTLLESYSKRMTIAESVYGKAHGGEKLDQNRKLVLARCLKNLTESFNSSQGTQRSDMGAWKRFCLE